MPTMSEPVSLASGSVDDIPPRHSEEVPKPDWADGMEGVTIIPVWSAGFPAERIGPIQWRSVAGLRPYAPRFIETPSFRGAPSWEMLRQLLKESGVRDPLLVLPDGRVLDGVHRLDLARALGLTEVPIRLVDVPEPCSESDRMQLETMKAALDAARRHLDPPHLRRLLLDLTQAEIQLSVVNRRVANLRRGRVAGSGPTVPTQRERGRTVGMSERAIRQMDRILREGAPDLVEAVRAGAVTVKEADRRLTRRKASDVPTGTVRARETPPGGDGGPGPTNPEAAHAPCETGAQEGAPSPIPPAVEAFMAVCHALHEATRDFIRDTAHWTGERRAQRNFTIWQGLRQLEEHLDWMDSATDVRPGEI
jgi:hypothetical protein